MTSEGWEPDAGKRHVRIGEGPGGQSDRVKIWWHHRETRWQTEKTNLNLNHRETPAYSPGAAEPPFLTMENQPPRLGYRGRSSDEEVVKRSAPMRFSLRTLLVMTCLVALTIVAAINCLGPIRPHSSVAKISKGMTHEDVERILGTPNGRTSQKAWSYRRFMNPGWLVVYFDDAGCVQYVDHEPPLP